MKQWIRVVVGLGLIVALLAAVDWHSLLVQVERVDWPPALLAFCGYGLQLFISGWKWRWALRILEVRLSTVYLVRLYCIAHFVGQFLPTAIGGDAYRAYRTLSATRSGTRPISAIALDRVVGLTALLLLGGLGALQLAERFLIAKAYLVLFIIGGAVAFLCLAALHRGAFKPITRHFGRFTWFNALQQDYRQLQHAGSRWLPFVGLALLFQMISIGTTHILFIAVGSEPTFAQSALIVALAGLASTLPISINGLGITETSIVGSAVALGLSPEEALLVGILSRILVLPLTLACGVLYAAERRSGARDAGAKSGSPEPDVPLATFTQTSREGRSWQHSELLEYTHDAIIIWEMDGAGILYWNWAAEQLYGYSRTEARGMTTHGLLKTQLEGGVDQLEVKVAQYGIWVGNLRHTARDGRQVEVQSRLALMSQHTGRWLVLEVNRDVTDLHKADAAQKAAEAQLLSLKRRVQLR